MNKNKFKPGDKVKLNGNRAEVLGYIETDFNTFVVISLLEKTITLSPGECNSMYLDLSQVAVQEYTLEPVLRCNNCGYAQ